ncbi:MAG TPA: hypothetical protein DD733_01160 [Clostridiales bacterium]|nr:hypothetical protein [Eubacteriales bacterium]HBR30669.1 hypothetical protein [Clostridiales bacterium]
MRGNKLIYTAAMIAGIILICVSLIFFGDEESKILSGISIGIGAGLFGMSVAMLSINAIDNKKPELKKQNEIELSDERNIMIRDKAKARASDITKPFFILLLMLTILAEAPLWLTCVAIGVFLLREIIEFFLIFKYNKKM